MGIHNYTMPMDIGYFTHNLHNMTFPEYTNYSRSYITTYTDHDRWLYIQYRSLPATIHVYTFYTNMYMSTDHTKNTRSCTMTNTELDRWLYIRLNLLLGRRSTDVGIWYNTHGRALPTVRITLKIHGRVLWHIPITTDGFIFVSHYY